jgi:hypothetical protein
LINFLRLSPTDVSAHWEMLKTVVAYEVEEKDRERACSEILKHLMSGYMDCWVAMKEGAVVSVITTLVTQEPTGQRFLHIHSLRAFKGMVAEVATNVIESLETVARGKGCSKIVGFTTDQRIIGIVKHHGGNTDTVMIKMEV